jgi:Tfp pilus assembly protein PilN
MIRTNLSTRPFYNDRAVSLWIGIAAIVLGLVTVFNVTRIMRYAGSNTGLVQQASQDETRAAEARRNAASLRASVNVAQLNTASLDARQANDLIDRRTFSWTELFNRFEATLPDDVRITSISPTLDQQRNIVLNVTVLARTVEAVNEFMEHLDAAGAFRDLRSTQERNNEDDQIESVLQMIYVPTQPPGASDAAVPVAVPAR